MGGQRRRLGRLRPRSRRPVRGGSRRSGCTALRGPLRRWVNVAPLPSPVAEARMPPWARDLFLARVSRVPRAALLAATGPVSSSGSPGLGGSPRPLGGPGGLKRKRELGEPDGGSPAAPTLPALVESWGGALLVHGPRVRRLLGVAFHRSRSNPPVAFRYRARIRLPPLIPVRRMRVWYHPLPGVGH